MDMDMLGKPGKIQLTVIEEFEMKPKAKHVNSTSGLVFEGYEYRTDMDLDELMNPFIVTAAGGSRTSHKSLNRLQPPRPSYFICIRRMLFERD